MHYVFVGWNPLSYTINYNYGDTLLEFGGDHLSADPSSQHLYQLIHPQDTSIS